jgi:YtkA-like
MIGRRDVIKAIALASLTWQLACGGQAPLTELQRVKSGALDVVLLSPHDGLRHGKDTFAIEFRSNGSLMDAGTVRANATMPMPGSPMFGSIDVSRTDVAGRYTASGQFDMAGTWRLTIDWDGGAAGKGSVTFAGTVQ